MTSSFTTFVTRDEFNLFHTIDRSLYTRLVLNLHRDPAESMLVIAFFIWLERNGFGILVARILSFPHLLINELANEAVTCLDYINKIINNLGSPSSSSSSSSSSSELFPVMRSALSQGLTLRFFRENRQNALQGIATIVDTVCVRALSDIMNQAIERNRSFGSPPVVTRGLMPLPGFPRWLWNPQEVVPPDDRTLFITFSKGYPVQECEVREFFTRNYGDCVESIYMQDVTANEQSLFARIVFRAVSMIGRILDESGRAKFTINGKHAWARKFVPKRSKIPNTQ